MQTLEAKKQWKETVLGSKGGAKKKPPEKQEKRETTTEAKERIKKEKRELNDGLVRLKDQRDKTERNIDEAYERFRGTGTKREKVAENVLGTDGLQKQEDRIKKIAETQKELERLDGETKEVEKREKIIAGMRKQKQTQLNKLREDTKALDEKINRDFDEKHITGISQEERLTDWFNQNSIPKKQRDDYLVKKKLQEKYQNELDGPEPEPPPPRPKRTPDEEEKERAKWRKALAAFQPHKAYAERAREGPGKAIEEKYGEAMQRAEEKEYEEGIKLLKEATSLAKNARRELQAEREKIAEETKIAAEKQKEAFNFTTQVKDQDWGFDTDDDARNFYLANSVNELGGLEKSPQLKKMEQVYADCLKRRDQLKKMGASIDEIVEAVYKNVPKNFWPDDVVKEVVLYKAVKEQIEAEERLAQSEMDLEAVMEKVEEYPGFVGEQSTEAWEWSLMADTIKENFPEAKDVETSQITDALSHFSDICSALSDSTMGFLKMTSALESQGELEEAREENPVKAKILEFQRNKAIIECANSLVSAGLDVAGEAVLAEAVPLLGAISKSKDGLKDLAGAITYFKNLAAVDKLKQGATIDPRTAALRPLARQAREQKIAASDKLISSVSKLLQAAGKMTELAHVAAPVGLAIDVAGKAISYAGKIVISGINWSDASKAVASIKLAVGPPPNRKAQFAVLQNSAKYARVALAQLARNGDPWAVGHLENMGLGREDINNKATTNKLLREYMALMSGGTMADGIGEDQQTFGETKVARAAKFVARGIVKGAEKVRDLIVGRDTGIPYDSSWRLDAATVDFAPEGWKTARTQAIAAGWYDSRPSIDADLALYQQARGKVDGHLKTKPKDAEALKEAVEDATALITALVAIRNQTRSIKAVANDRATPHAGMAAFLDGWGRRADEEASEVTKTRSGWIDNLAFPKLKGEKLKEAKEKFLQEAEETARERQADKAKNVGKKVRDLLKSYKVRTPYGACRLDDFAAKAAEKLDLDPRAMNKLAKEVAKLELGVRARLHLELMASPTDEELEKNFENSIKTVEPILVEGLRAACEQRYQRMQKRKGVTEEEGWTPSSGDVVLKATAWESVRKAAAEKGWPEKGKIKGIGGGLAAYEAALAEFEKERSNSPQNRTTLEQAQGILLGRIDELVTALENFKPLTEQRFLHQGLSAWRDGMIEECASARVEHGAPLFEE